jgi:heme A synthase
LDPDGALRRFRRLVLATVGATYLLIVVGGVVRVGDSGLGCGPEGSGLSGWPLCQGGLVPGAQTHPVVEYTHRFLAAAVVALLAVILWQALRRFRRERPVVLGAVAAMLLVLVQAVLGGLTVEHGLETALVAAHLGTAMLLLAVLIALLAVTRPRPAAAPPSRSLLGAAVVASVLLLATIVAGGVIAGTERHGTPGEDTAAGAHLACGREFPTCNGSVLPFGSGEMVDIQLAHRVAMLLAVLAIAALAMLLGRRRELERLRAAILVALAAQVVLGASNVWYGEHPALIVAHLALGTLLWVLVVAATAAVASAAAALPAARPAGARSSPPLKGGLPA